MEIKDFIIKEINQREELASAFKEEVEIEEKNDEKYNQEEIKVDKEIVIDYLMKSGYELTPDNYNRAEQMLLSMESDKLANTLINAGKTDRKRYKTINHLYDLSVDELNSLLNNAMLNALNSINNNTLQPRIEKYEYAIEVVKDTMGATNILKLSSVINKYSNEGYRVVSAFTNEIGKNAVSINGVGVNSTSDQVVIIFERPVYQKT